MCQRGSVGSRTLKFEPDYARSSSVATTAIVGDNRCPSPLFSDDTDGYDTDPSSVISERKAHVSDPLIDDPGCHPKRRRLN
jgi:hypothetical protein